jgi:hypothetical protein
MKEFHNWVKFKQWTLCTNGCPITPPLVVPPLLVAPLPLALPFPLFKLLGVVVAPPRATIPLMIKT